MIALARRRRFPLLALLALIVAGCGATGPTPASNRPTASADRSPVLTPVPGGTTGPSGPVEPAPAQIDTDWGRIWDSLPPSFPVPPEAFPAEPFEGPASAAFGIGASGDQAADRFVAGLAPAGYSIEGRSRPLEDGSVVIDAVGADPACRVQVRVTPLSGTTRVVVMFGAACPFE